MFRKSTNNPWVPLQGLNQGSFAQIGNSTDIVGTRFQGMLGQVIVLSQAEAAKASLSSVGTLYQGAYQLVKLTSAVTRGQIVFWESNANNGIGDFEVTSTVAATTMFRAGVAICNGTSGEYAYIQVAGLASCLYRATVTSAIIGNLVVAESATSASVDALADAGAFATALLMKSLIGIAYELPVNASVRRVLLNLGGFYPNMSS